MLINQFSVSKKKTMYEIAVLNFFIDLSPKLKATYDLYQD